MRIHDIGPRTEVGYPPAKESSWGTDYGTHGFADRDRPYIDDQPPHRAGWDASSLWGSRPVREFGGESNHGGATVFRSVKLAWRRIRNALRDSL